MKNELKQKYQSEDKALINAIHRCHSPHNAAYKNYGARGIKVCDEWRNPTTGFQDFIDHIGPKPSPSLSLDRLDNDKGYEPGNVAWRTRREQNLNRRTFAQKVTIAGEVRTLEEWGQISGVDATTIRSRIVGGRAEHEWLHKGRLPHRKSQNS